MFGTHATSGKKRLSENSVEKSRASAPATLTRQLGETSALRISTKNECLLTADEFAKELTRPMFTLALNTSDNIKQKVSIILSLG